MQIFHTNIEYANFCCDVNKIIFLTKLENYKANNMQAVLKLLKEILQKIG